MVVRLRLSRKGTRNNPFYHVVAINDSKPRDARPIEKLGEWDPIPRPAPSGRLPTPFIGSAQKTAATIPVWVDKTRGIKRRGGGEIAKAIGVERG